MYENLQTIIATVSTSVVEQRIRGGTSEIKPKNQFHELFCRQNHIYALFLPVTNRHKLFIIIVRFCSYHQCSQINIFFESFGYNQSLNFFQHSSS